MLLTLYGWHLVSSYPNPNPNPNPNPSPNPNPNPSPSPSPSPSPNPHPNPHPHPKQVTMAALAGGAAGSASRVVAHPLDTLRVLHSTSAAPAG